MKFLKKVGKYGLIILAAAGTVVLIALGLNGWWDRRKLRKGLTATAADLATTHVELAEKTAEANAAAVKDKATLELEDHLGKINVEIEKDANTSSLADYLRSRGAGKDK